MDKRGQIYILVALILALVLYMLMTKTNLVYEQDITDDFETLSKNYDIEASKFMNSLLSEGDTNIITKFDKFTVDFTNYALNQNPDFGLIYVFDYEDENGDNLYIGNYLRNPIIIGTTDPVLLGGCLGEVTNCVNPGLGNMCYQSDTNKCYFVEPSISSLDITIGSRLYTIDVVKGRPEIVIVSREDKGDQRKVYAEEEFVSGDPTEGAAISGTEFCKSGSKESSGIAIGRGSEITSKGDICSDICNYFNENKEACMFDTTCCWVESDGGGRCIKGACST